MAIRKTVEIDGKAVEFKASAAIPRIYRLKFGRDIFVDLNNLSKALEGDTPLDVFSLEIFENVAYIMAKHASPTIPDTAEEWLDDFNTFSIYQILPEIMELWGNNLKSDVEAKKNMLKVSES